MILSVLLYLSDGSSSQRNFPLTSGKEAMLYEKHEVMFRQGQTGEGTFAFVLNKIPSNTGDVQVGKFIHHEVNI